MSGTVTITAGDTTATINIPTLNDALVESTETVIVTLIGITSGDPLAAIDAANDAATITLADDDSAVVSIATSTNGLETGPANGVFTVTQSAAASVDTVLTYSVGGDAASSSDYSALSGTVTIVAGSTSATSAGCTTVPSRPPPQINRAPEAVASSIQPSTRSASLVRIIGPTAF